MTHICPTQFPERFVAYFPQFYKYYIYQPKKEINVKNVKKRLSGTDRTTF